MSTDVMKSTVVPNPWHGAVYFILNIIYGMLKQYDYV